MARIHCEVEVGIRRCLCHDSYRKLLNTHVVADVNS